MEYMQVDCEKMEEIMGKIKGKAGVWFLLGNEDKNEKLICLQVAQKDDIGKEIETDVQYIRANDLKPICIKKYVNQFGEAKFDYEEWGQWRARNLYYHIAQNYSNLKFVCIWDDKIFDEKSYRELLEKYIAYKTKAVFWVNGRPFDDEKSDEYKKDLLKQNFIECNSIREKLVGILDEVNVATIDNNIANYVYAMDL